MSNGLVGLDDGGHPWRLDAHGDVVVFFEEGLEVEGVSFANVLNAEVVHEEAEYDGAPVVLPQTWGGGALVVVVLLEALPKECVGEGS